VTIILFTASDIIHKLHHKHNQHHHRKQSDIVGNRRRFSDSDPLGGVNNNHTIYGQGSSDEMVIAPRPSNEMEKITSLGTSPRNKYIRFSKPGLKEQQISYCLEYDEEDVYKRVPVSGETIDPDDKDT